MPPERVLGAARAPAGSAELRSAGEAIRAAIQQLETAADSGRLRSHNFDDPEYKALEVTFTDVRAALGQAERAWAMSKGEIQTRRICCEVPDPEGGKKDALFLAGEMAVAAQKVVTTKVAEAEDMEKQSKATKQTVERMRPGLMATAVRMGAGNEAEQIADFFLGGADGASSYKGYSSLGTHKKRQTK